MNMAKEASTRSTCRKKVGAIIVDSNGYIVSTGFNGSPSNMPSCEDLGGCIREKLNIKSGTQYQICRALHAECNAISQAGIKNTVGCTMYVYGHYDMCIMCKNKSIQAKLGRIVVKRIDNNEIIEYTLDSLKKSVIEYYNNLQVE